MPNSWLSPPCMCYKQLLQLPHLDPDSQPLRLQASYIQASPTIAHSHALVYAEEQSWNEASPMNNISYTKTTQDTNHDTQRGEREG